MLVCVLETLSIEELHNRIIFEVQWYPALYFLSLCEVQLWILPQSSLYPWASHFSSLVLVFFWSVTWEGGVKLYLSFLLVLILWRSNMSCLTQKIPTDFFKVYHNIYYSEFFFRSFHVSRHQNAPGSANVIPILFNNLFKVQKCDL